MTSRARSRAPRADRCRAPPFACGCPCWSGEAGGGPEGRGPPKCGPGPGPGAVGGGDGAAAVASILVPGVGPAPARPGDITAREDPPPLPRTPKPAAQDPPPPASSWFGGTLPRNCSTVPRAGCVVGWRGPRNRVSAGNERVGVWGGCPPNGAQDFLPHPPVLSKGPRHRRQCMHDLPFLSRRPGVGVVPSFQARSHHHRALETRPCLCGAFAGVWGDVCKQARWPWQCKVLSGMDA